MPDQREEYSARVDSDLEELIPGFMDNRRTDIRSIENFLERHDYESIRGIGHMMKGNGAGYGFERISDIGKSLEKAAGEEDSEKISSLLSDLAYYIDTVKIVYI